MHARLASVLLAAVLLSSVAAQTGAPYFPDPGEWRSRTPYWDNDLVLVVRWIRSGAALTEFIARVLASMKPT